MKRLNIFIFLFMFSLVIPAAEADTIYLKDGSIIQGQIESKSSDKVIIKVKGVPKRYFMQQIDSIDETTAIEKNVDNSLENLRKISEIPQEKVKLILKFLDVDGTKKRMQENLKAAIANAPAERQAELTALINVDEILNQLVPMYDKVFEKSELDEIIMFYESFAGQKLIEISPIILNETVKITYNYIKNKYNASKK